MEPFPNPFTVPGRFDKAPAERSHPSTTDAAFGFSDLTA